MPELPEVETTRLGIAPFLQDAIIVDVTVRDRRLRWPVNRKLAGLITGQKVHSVTRRGKYIIVNLNSGALIIHLGMSGSLRLVDKTTAPEKHDHYDLALDSGKVLRYRDPRRFGSLHWTSSDPLLHKLLKNLGPEPLSEQFTGSYLFEKSRNRKLKIKLFIMDSHIVPGVGNIYANEALFLSQIRPGVSVGRVSASRHDRLATSIKQILNDAIRMGGTTLRDFINSDGKPGYFKQNLFVYGKDGEACRVCGNIIKSRVINQRSTYYCPNCQN
jgi:formamidopyrimidine-DNA glycosylase